MVEVSIIVPAYNVEDYVERCIKSVIKQTFKYWEMLIIDDGSTDNTGIICRKYTDIDKRIKYFYQENQGQGIARNKGLDNATGKYIFFLDSDDWIREDTLEILYFFSEKEKLDLVFFDRITVSVNEKNEIVSEYSKLPILIEGVTNCKNTPELLYRLEGAVWDKFYQRNVLLGIRQKGTPYEDSAVLPHILLRAQRIGQVKDALYFYWCSRNDSTVNKCETVFYIKDSIEEANKSLLGIEENSLYKEYLRRYSEWMVLVAKYHISRQKLSLKSRVVYDNFIEECWKLIENLFSNEKKMRSYNYIVWGSYNLRSMVNRTQRNHRNPRYHYGYSNITSLMQERKKKSINRGINNNVFREQMIQFDIEQHFKNLKPEELKTIDFVCIDLLEERFSPVSIDREIITGSDALEDVVKIVKNNDLYLGSVAWQENMLKFIRLLKTRFKNQQIILVENYLSIGYGRYGIEKEFDEQYGNIKEINKKLRECYQFFSDHFDGIYIVTNKRKELEFTDVDYPHGCYPWHQNEYLYYEMADKIEQIVLNDMEC